MARRLSLDLLRGFRAAARHLSFTRAAQELHVTQSAISHEIRTLEEQIGKPLFRRVHRGLELTQAGAHLYRATDEALALVDAAADRIAESRQAIAVTTTTALASLWLAPRLPRFNQLYPGIDVRLVASNDKPDMEREQLDVAIRFVPAGADAPDAEVLFDVKLFPVCAPALARGTKPLQTPADLANHVRLDFETLRDGRPWSEWDVWFRAIKLEPVKPASTLFFPQYDHVVPAAIAGSGVAVGARPHLTTQLREGTLCAPFGDHAVAKLGSFHLVTRNAENKPEEVETFVEWLRSEARRDSGLTLATPRSRNRTPARRVA